MIRAIRTTIAFGMLLATQNLIASDSGIVNFNLGKSPFAGSPPQPVTLYGCNTVIHSDLFWDSANQVVGGIPYGWQSDNSYYVSKYYMSSPPAFSDDQSAPVYLGLVTPDRFTFEGMRPAQIVYFDYYILKPMYYTNIPVDYTHKPKGKKSCAELGVDIIPMNTSCADYPWRNGALGASGVGHMANTKEKRNVVLPLLEQGKDPLQCATAILDDIILNFDISFALPDGTTSKTVNLTDYFAPRKNKTLALQCLPRVEDIPTGCRAPDSSAL